MRTMELLLLLLLTAALMLCTAAGQSFLLALVFGLLLFLAYGLRKGHRLPALLRAAWSGAGEVRGVLVSLLLIGLLSAAWRAGGTIAYLVSLADRLCTPQTTLALCFLLCCLVSFLTGSAFASSATMGVVAMALAQRMGLPVWLAAGAVLGGVYFGDRCSPISGSALLVAEVTRSSIHGNIKSMLRRGWVPFLLSLGLYAVLGCVLGQGGGDGGSMWTGFVLHPLALVPGGLILLCTLLRVNSRWTLLSGIASALVLAVVQQGCTLAQLPGLLLWGSQRGGGLFQGGGVASMVPALLSVALSAAYTGIFHLTGFLEPLRRACAKLRGGTAFRYSCVSLLTGMTACNQTLTILLTKQLLEGEEQGEAQALRLEDSAVLLPAVIPWSTAFTVPAAAMGVGAACLPGAFFLYLVPVWDVVREHLPVCGTRRAGGPSRRARNTGAKTLLTPGPNCAKL